MVLCLFLAGPRPGAWSLAGASAPACGCRPGASCCLLLAKLGKKCCSHPHGGKAAGRCTPGSGENPLAFGAKTAWGKGDARENGELLDQHAQAGTGSTDWLAGVSGVHLLDEKSSLYGSFQVRLTGDNGRGYEYGDTRS